MIWLFIAIMIAMHEYGDEFKALLVAATNYLKSKTK